MTTPPPQQPPQPPAPVQPAPVVERLPVGEAKTLGMVGAILNLVGILAGPATGYGFILILVGVILIYMAASKLSSIVRDDRIKKYYFTYFILAIIAIIVLIVGFVAFIGAALIGMGTFNPEVIFAAFGALFIVGVVVWILAIIGTLNLRKSYELIKKYTGVDMFGTTGFLYFLGAILLIILVGALIVFIAVILEIVAWASLPEYVEARKEVAPTPATLV